MLNTPRDAPLLDRVLNGLLGFSLFVVLVLLSLAYWCAIVGGCLFAVGYCGNLLAQLIWPPLAWGIVVGGFLAAGGYANWRDLPWFLAIPRLTPLLVIRTLESANGASRGGVGT
jgi:hypothetical protein